MALLALDATRVRLHDEIAVPTARHILDVVTEVDHVTAAWDIRDHNPRTVVVLKTSESGVHSVLATDKVEVLVG